jgi:hypothetical protein
MRTPFALMRLDVAIALDAHCQVEEPKRNERLNDPMLNRARCLAGGSERHQWLDRSETLREQPLLEEE